MGKRGPAKTPTAKLARRGSERGKKRAKLEPKPPPSNHEPPIELTDSALPYWREMVDKLVAMNILESTDHRALQRYCETLVRWAKANDYLNRNGFSYPIYGSRKLADGSEESYVKCLAQFPEVSIESNLSAALLRLESQFGLTPATRPDVTAAAGGKAGGGDPTPDFVRDLFRRSTSKAMDN